MRNNHEESFERLNHILNAVDSIESYTDGVQEPSFSMDPMLIDAVLFQFTVIGEAIKHVESEKLKKYDYPWHKVRAFRNFIAHEYFEINTFAVWTTIKNDLPHLKSVVKTILKNEF